MITGCKFNLFEHIQPIARNIRSNGSVSIKLPNDPIPYKERLYHCSYLQIKFLLVTLIQKQMLFYKKLLNKIIRIERSR